ncbi:MAG: chemotaxis protein CheA [bacterium]
MEDPALRPLLEDIVARSLAATADDRAALEDIVTRLGDLIAKCGDEDDGARRVFVAARANLNDVLAGEALDASATLASVVRSLATVRDAGESPPASRDAEDPSPGGPLVLDEFIDEEIFGNFLSGATLVVEEIESDILAMEADDPAAARDLRGRVHTLKGDSGTLGLRDLEFVCHALEDYLDREVPPAARIRALLEARDWMSGALEAHARMRRPEEPGEAMAARLFAAPAESPSTAPVPASAEAPATPTAGPKAPVWDEDTLEVIGEFLQESEEGLARVDEILLSLEGSEADPESVNELFRVFHTMKGVASFLGLDEITRLAHSTETLLNLVRTHERTLDGALLELVFDATEATRRLRAAVRSSVETGHELESDAALPALLDRLERCRTGDPEGEAESPGSESATSLSIEPSPDPSPGGRPEPTHGNGPLSGEPRPVPSAAAPPKPGRDGVRIRQTVKVDVDRVDQLVNMIGELVIVESMLVNAAGVAEIGEPRIRDYLGQLKKATRDLQDVGMRMRMVPVRSVFQKMARMVRDLSHRTGKAVRLTTAGEWTEMDRSMVEQIEDPLVHMIRNAVDHGIESPDRRSAAGKPPVGEIRLSAYHESGNIVIEITDDGPGLNRNAILEKARANGLIGETEPVSDADVFDLIFAPGLSTAARVTEVSGRGVGMDVVKRNIKAMRGRVNVSSEPGHGTRFKIVLPLTLAIIDGMLVACGPERYVVPILSIVESIQVDASMHRTMGGKHDMVEVRGELLPLVRIDRLFGVEGAKSEITSGLVVIVEGVGRKVGLLIDDVITQQQVVIKNVGEGIESTPFVSGAAILSDGLVGLILNVEEICSVVSNRTAVGHGAVREGVAVPEALLAG